MRRSVLHHWEFEGVEEAFRLANKRHLPPGKHLKTYLAQHYSKE
jgi:hypothetical protein